MNQKEHLFTRLPKQTHRGIAVFSKNNFYWGIASQKEMRAFLDMAWDKGFAYAQEHFVFTSRFDYAEQYSRADFHFLLPLTKDATILDLGSGYGNITIPLARYYRRVVAADASLELLEFSKARAIAEGLTSIEYVHIDPLYALDLPFKENSFDAIILNGVLEWAAHGSDATNPALVQEQLLKRLYALLKDDGVLCIGIENRWFPGWLPRDPHSKLKWTSILPRRIADWYARRHGFEKGYQTYIYSKPGYRRLLWRAGFKQLKFYYPFPSYRLPLYVYSDDHPVRTFLHRSFLETIYTRKWSIFIRLVALLGLDRVFLSSFTIIAAKSVNRKMTPRIISAAVEQQIKEVSEGDLVMKVAADDEGLAKANFFVFHAHDARPYGTLSAARNPSNHEERALELRAFPEGER